jgi:hypothetical protein
MVEGFALLLLNQIRPGIEGGGGALIGQHMTDTIQICSGIIKTRNFTATLKNVLKCKFVSPFSVCTFHPRKQKSWRRPCSLIELYKTEWTLKF